MVRLTEPAAKSLIRSILAGGTFVAPSAGSHARIEMDKDGLADGDLINVLNEWRGRAPW